MITEIKEVLFGRINQLKHLEFSGRQNRSSLSLWNAQLQAIVLEGVNAIECAAEGKEVVKAVAEMNKKITSLINKVLSEIDRNTSIGKLAGTFDTLGELIYAMNAADLCLAQYVHAVIDESVTLHPEEPVWSKLQEIAKHIDIEFVFPSEINNDVNAMKKVNEIVQQARLLILASLLKEAHTAMGLLFINELALSITAEHPLKILPGVTFDFYQTSMGVSANGAEAIAKIDKTIDVHVDMERRDQVGVINGSGDHSSLDVPILIPMEYDDDIPNFFAEDDVVEKSMRCLMSGRLFIDAKDITYSPFQIMVLHEYIHVLHNANGENFRNIPLTAEEEKRWSTYEEYKTIRQGKFNEAQFANSYGILRPRECNGFAHPSELFEPKIRNSENTIALISAYYLQKNAIPHSHKLFSIQAVISFFKSAFFDGTNNPGNDPGSDHGNETRFKSN